MNKILLSLLTISLVSVVAVGATKAYFSDTETSTGNSFTAGTLDLNLDGGNSNVVKFTVANAKPGDVGGAAWTVDNVGSLPGYLDIHSITRVDNENGCNEPETAVEAPGSCDNPGPGQGELSANMNVDLYVDANINGVNDAGDTTIYTGVLSGIATDYPDLDLALAASGTNHVRLDWGIPTTAENIIQSDSTTLGLTFELGQTAAQ